MSSYKMIIHDQRRRQVKVIGSRVPVYEMYYEDGFPNIVKELFTKIAPKAISLSKQLGMKALRVVRDKVVNTIGHLAGSAVSAVKDS